MTGFEISGKTVSVYPSATSDRPIVYLNTYSDMGDQVYHLLRDASGLEFTLVVIGNLSWDHDMSPWAIPPIAKGDTPCTGGADEYLQLLTGKIISRVENGLAVSWRGIAGYSLAGLFALYSLYQTDLFHRAATMSGSLWFPDFQEYVFSHEMKRTPERVYFSLGDKECKTRNPYLKVVQDRTERIETFFRGKGIPTVFQLNPGNHSQGGVERTAAGIRWILKQ